MYFPTNIGTKLYKKNYVPYVCILIKILKLEMGKHSVTKEIIEILTAK
jgi:hypothetical protein